MAKQLTRRVALAAFALGLAIGGPSLAQTFPVKFIGFGAGQLRNLPLVVPSYQIAFYTSHQATASGGVLTKSRLTTSLSNVPESLMRKLADDAHADLMTKMQAASLPMAPIAEARLGLQSAGLEAMPGNRDVRPIGAGITIGADVKKGYVVYGAAEAPALRGLHSAGATGGMAIAGTMGALNKAAAAARAQKAIFVLPSLVLDFANTDANAGRDFLGRESASASSRLQFGLAGVSMAALYTPTPDGRFGTPGAMRISKDHTVPTPFGAVLQGEGAVRALSVATVTNSMYIDQEAARGDAVVVDLPAWEGLVRTAYQDFNNALVAEIRKARGV